MKRLKHISETFETLETRRRRRPRPTWWGTAVASNVGLGGRQEQWPNVHPSVGAPTATSSWWHRGGGMVNVVAVTGEVGWGRGRTARCGHGGGSHCVQTAQWKRPLQSEVGKCSRLRTRVREASCLGRSACPVSKRLGGRMTGCKHFRNQIGPESVTTSCT
jgi:hypothetical protein